MEKPAPSPPVIDERGGDGQTSNRRLFMQLLVFEDQHDAHDVATAMREAKFEGVVYADLHNPSGLGLLTMHEDPAFFVDELRPWIGRGPLGDAMLQPEMTMFGRTYAIGYEPDLEDVLLQRPRRHVLTNDWPWAVWYPLRRSGAFAQLPREEQAAMLKEHGAIGMRFGRAGLAHDVRLACHGLDRDDNDFVIGLTGKELAPLSKLVEQMRRTKQTSQYLETLGPFFVGKVVWQSEQTG